MSEASAWDRFVASVDRGVQSREDLESFDLTALRELDDIQRERARQLLAGKLDDGDPRVVDALAELRTPKAWDDVERAFTASWGSAQVHAAVWLWMRNKDSRVVPQLKALAARNANAPTLVTEIVGALERIETPDADDAMVDILAASKDRGVASATTDRIFARHKWDQWEQPGFPIFTLRCGLTSMFPSVRSQAIAELKALEQRQHGGEDDVQLGVTGQELGPHSATLQQVLAMALDASKPVPDNAAIDGLQGPERVWAADLLLKRLEQSDARVVPALLLIGGERARLAMADYQANRRIS
jgi:hypothetical protein